MIDALVDGNGGTEGSRRGRLKFFYFNYEKIKFSLKTSTLTCYSWIYFSPVPVGLLHVVVEYVHAPKDCI
jgi:hypothetical protein